MKKERPILFSGEMVKAILDGRKTQTRRVVKFPASFLADKKPPKIIKVRPNLYANVSGDFTAYDANNPNDPWLMHVSCPYGKVGDLLWARETWTEADGIDGREIYYAASESEISRYQLAPWKPSIHMPRTASRITLEITNIRVERLQDISETDAKAEGFGAVPVEMPTAEEIATNPQAKEFTELFPGGVALTAKLAFMCKWNERNAKRGFAFSANPYVWVIEFKRLLK